VKAKLLGDLKAGRSFEPTPSVAASATAGAKGAAPAAPATPKKPSAIKITVRNGAGVSGVAKQASLILKAKGFTVVDTGNANQNVYKKTLVVYKTDRPSADLVSGSLMPGTTVVESRGMYSYNSEILVVVGKDWDPAKVPAAAIQTQ
jgi:hypothetical protein